jgi:hypothetical protein
MDWYGSLSRATAILSTINHRNNFLFAKDTMEQDTGNEILVAKVLSTSNKLPKVYLCFIDVSSILVSSS